MPTGPLAYRNESLDESFRLRNRDKNPAALKLDFNDSIWEIKGSGTIELRLNLGASGRVCFIHVKHVCYLRRHDPACSMHVVFFKLSIFNSQHMQTIALLSSGVDGLDKLFTSKVDQNNCAGVDTTRVESGYFKIGQ